MHAPNDQQNRSSRVHCPVADRAAQIVKGRHLSQRGEGVRVLVESGKAAELVALEAAVRGEGAEPLQAGRESSPIDGV